MNKIWNDVYRKNYHKSLDYRSFQFKQVGSCLRTEFQHKKPQFQYRLFQDCSFLYLSSGCKPIRGDAIPLPFVPRLVLSQRGRLYRVYRAVLSLREQLYRVVLSQRG
eukprot:529876-Rhodomonas_salina.1